MEKKIISDIRLFKSKSQNDLSSYIPDAKKINAIVNRMVMKLRENEFSLGEFDHLYINFTTCDMPEKIIEAPANKYVEDFVINNLKTKIDSLMKYTK